MPTVMNIPVKNIEENPSALREPQVTDEQYIKLKDSIEREGVLESILVMPAMDATGTHVKHNANGEPLYRLIDGLQRWTASKELGLETIPASVSNNKSDLEVYLLQIITNSVKVETKPAEYAAQLARIMTLDPTMTALQLCAKLSKSPSWLDDRLHLLKLKSEYKKAVDEGEIPLSNAVDLAKLPVEEQEAFVERAKTDTNAIFGPAVKQRIKQLREAKRKGLDPEAVKAYTPVAHHRKLIELEAFYKDPTGVVKYVVDNGATDIESAVKATIEWAIQLDPASIAQGKAEAEARKAKDEADKVKRKAEREALKVKEKAAVEAVRKAAEKEAATVIGA